MVSFVRVARTALVLAAGVVAQATAQQCCVPDVTTYCTAGTTVHGCVPSIAGIGAPSAIAASGFEIVVSAVPRDRSGTLFYGFYQSITPWAPGSFSYKCIASPTQRMGVLMSGGTFGQQCSGELRQDFNAWRAANPGGLGSPFIAGQVFHAQAWFRDPAAPKGTNLSNALRFVLDGCFATPAGMAEIAPGSFLMGSDAADACPYHNHPSNGPVHQVTLSRCYWMGVTEVSQAQYTALMGTNPSHFPGPNLPVESVSWDAAQLYCMALNSQQSALGAIPQGYHYRLPTEAEWEYACRAGTTTEFNTGPDIVCNQAQIGATRSPCPGPNQCGYVSTAAVDSYTPNAWGLKNMHGNVREWCLDSFELYTPGSSVDPFVTGGQFRTIRGGSWDLPSEFVRSAFRALYLPGHGDWGTGIRVVLAPILVP